MADALLPNGISIAYDDLGPATGTPLVLVHGHPFDRTMWAPQLAALHDEFRVIAPDLRGYGGSTVAPGTTPFAAFAHDIEALLDRLGVHEFVLGGLSMGGQIAMECVRLFGERIVGLVLADTSPAAETDEGRTWRRELAERLLREGMKGYADEVLHRMVAPHSAPEVQEHVHRMMCATDPEGAAAALRGRAERPDYRSLLARFMAPALVVVGAEDTYTPVDEARAMHAALPHATLRVIDGAAHLPNLERPDDFNAALRAFLSAR
ncbi:alpha/beta fold hydrolase [Streptomyces boluensis]|uniref:Alpha/beta fold hydrolase n=1 Tax=Streptomyces boluensis TaxID=1775135 RepID=A0A964XQJ0_9ACTN|nr:alpha/beta hydrolase [Streptomyces boluensis]NBE55673.1 alpha/beta fold hydrolase [Streptomyces boluensis]